MNRFIAAMLAAIIVVAAAFIPLQVQASSDATDPVEPIVKKVMAVNSMTGELEQVITPANALTLNND